MPTKKTEDDKSIEFISTVYKVQTLADGGIRLTLDLPETEIIAAAKLMSVQIDQVVLAVVCKKY